MWLTVIIFMGLIQLYTLKGGIKTIIWTDTLQTTFMLAAVVITIFIILKHMDVGLLDAVSEVWSSDLSDIIITDINSKQNFVKLFLSGIFITIVMTGLDQDMMQKEPKLQNIERCAKKI